MEGEMEDLVSLLSPVAGLVFLATLVEGTVEYFIAEPLKKKAPRFQLYVRYVALVIGVFCAFSFRANLPELFGLKAVDSVAYVATGLVIARGSNYMSDLIGSIRQR